MYDQGKSELRSIQACTSVWSTVTTDDDGLPHFNVIEVQLVLLFRIVEHEAHMRCYFIER